MTRVALALVLLTSVAARADDDVMADAPSLRVLAMKDGQPALAPSVKVGERFQLVVTATARPDVVVGMPAAFDSGVFEVLERQERTTPGSSEHVYELTVVAWEPGRQSFPPIPITYVPKGQGQLQQVTTAELEVEVVPVLADEEAKVDLRPLAPPVSVYEKDWTLVIVAAAAGGALLAAAALWLAVRAVRRRRARARAEEPVVDLRPPHEIALARLEALGSSPLLDEADRKPFTFAMTEVVREYLGRRFGFNALDMTTSELLEALSAQPEALRVALERWLSACDLVKFARLPASREDATAMLREAVALVEMSKPVPPVVVMPAPAPEAADAG